MNKEEKAESLINNDKVELIYLGKDYIDFKVNGHSVSWTRSKGWFCKAMKKENGRDVGCYYFSKTYKDYTCSHILACKLYLKKRNIYI